MNTLQGLPRSSTDVSSIVLCAPTKRTSGGGGGGGEVELSSSMSCVHCGTDGEPKERATSVGGGGGGGGGR